ncbi:MAG: hypothetical protein ACOCX1_02960, partial [Fimbriimonadaceae bacterium]
MGKEEKDQPAGQGSAQEKEESSSKLKRTVSTPLFAMYGAGTILGAGIFVLIGKVAGTAGYWAPIAFIMAATVAGFNGMAYAELATRSPQAGGPREFI